VSDWNSPFLFSFQLFPLPSPTPPSHSSFFFLSIFPFELRAIYSLAPLTNFFLHNPAPQISLYSPPPHHFGVFANPPPPNLYCAINRVPLAFVPFFLGRRFSFPSFESEQGFRLLLVFSAAPGALSSLVESLLFLYNFFFLSSYFFEMCYVLFSLKFCPRPLLISTLPLISGCGYVCRFPARPCYAFAARRTLFVRSIPSLPAYDVRPSSGSSPRHQLSSRNLSPLSSSFVFGG